MKDRYRVIGLMSGTSLDGLDICLAEFLKDGDYWEYQIQKAVTIAYDDHWRSQLRESINLSASDLVKLDHQYGLWLAQQVNEFINSGDTETRKPDLIASHGHTVFHEPEQGITYQLGCGPELMSKTGITVITDFRKQDVALGGQGAPLVPVGDQMLFSEYSACLNLGGFANISFAKAGKQLAFDICPANLVLNSLASELGHSFDRDGLLATKGELDAELLQQLNQLEYYGKTPPKSLGAEWVENIVKPILAKARGSILDKLRTFTEHIAIQIAAVLNEEECSRCLVTGGGALNSFLMKRIGELTHNEILIPDRKTLEFKEALIFAFLGILRLRGEINVLSSVTGASRSHSSGIIYIP